MKIFLLLFLLSFNAFAANLTVKITNIQNKKGFIRLAMYDNASDFPGNFVNAVESENILVKANTATAIFKNLSMSNLIPKYFSPIVFKTPVVILMPSFVMNANDSVLSVNFHSI